jgi:CheY-like chemotaxis protein
MDRPEILLIEDELPLRGIYADELQASGAFVRLASDDEQGLDAFRQYVSSISAVITDMRLRSDSDEDHSGGEMAQKIRKMAPDLPIYCNSAIDVEKLFPSVFDGYYTKGSREIYKKFPEIVRRALSYENERFKSFPENLKALKDKYRISDVDFFDLVGNWRIPDLERAALLLFHESALIAESRHAGGGVPALSGSDQEKTIVFVSSDYAEWMKEFNIQRPIPIVLERTEDVWVAELFGFPLIYTYADDKEEAIQYLLKLLLDYKQQMTSGARMSSDGRNIDYIRFAAFLNVLFS